MTIEAILIGGATASHPKHATGVGRGGRQLRAGRPKGSKIKRPVVQRETLIAGRKLPLEYMLEVFNDSNASQERRDKFAIATAPYLHPRLTAVAEPKALFEMSDAEFMLVMHKQMRHAESRGDLEQAVQIRKLLEGRRGPDPGSMSRRGNGARDPAQFGNGAGRSLPPPIMRPRG